MRQLLFITFMFFASMTVSARQEPATDVAKNCHLARTVKLYTGSKPAADYGGRLQSVTDGDLISFGDVQFRVIKYLGEGQTTRVFEIAGHKVLRVPKAIGGSPAYYWIEKYLSSYAELKVDGISIAAVDENLSQAPRFLVVEKVDEKFTLAEFNNMYGDMNKDERKVIKQALGEFARTTWRYTWISDFRPDQLVYDGKRWILIDMGSDIPTQPLRNWDQGKSIFSKYELKDSWGIITKGKVVKNKLQNYLSEIIAEEREMHAKVGEWFERSKDGGDYFVGELMPIDQILGQTITFQPRYWENVVFTAKVIREHARKKNSIFYDVKLADGRSAIMEVLIKNMKNARFSAATEFYSADDWQGLNKISQGSDFRLFQFEKGRLEDHI